MNWLRWRQKTCFCGDRLPKNGTRRFFGMGVGCFEWIRGDVDGIITAGASYLYVREALQTPVYLSWGWSILFLLI